MKKLLITYLLYAAIFALAISFFNGWFDILYIWFWIGMFVGVILPDVDHLIYLYLKHPDELTSQTVAQYAKSKNFKSALNMVVETRDQRKDLIFHNTSFQWLFTVFAFFVVTSSGSLLGQGIVLGFMLHLSIDQIIDLTKNNTLDNWFVKVNMNLDKRQYTIYWVAVLVLLLFMGFFLV